MLNFIYGPMGVNAQKNLNNHKVVLEEHLNALSEQYSNYENSVRSLQSSVESVQLKARDMGYYHSEEKVIVIKGMGKPSFQYNPGKEIFYAGASSFRQVYFRIVSLTMFLIVFLLSSMFWKIKDD